MRAFRSSNQWQGSSEAQAGLTLDPCCIVSPAPSERARARERAGERGRRHDTSPRPTRLAVHAPQKEPNPFRVACHLQTAHSSVQDIPSTQYVVLVLCTEY